MVFEELKDPEHREQLEKLRASYAEVQRLRRVAQAAQNAAREAEYAWSRLLDESSFEAAHRHALERNRERVVRAPEKTGS